MRTIFTLAIVIASSSLVFCAPANNSKRSKSKAESTRVEKAEPTPAAGDASQYEIHDYMFEVIEPADQTETTSGKNEEIKATNKETGINHDYKSFEALKRSRRILERKYSLYT